MAEENYKFSCHGWKGTLIDILPDENNKHKVTMRPINIDLKYLENDLSFVWPKNADWSDGKTVPLKIYKSEELVTTLNGVKHKYEKIILATIFVHDAIITYTLHPEIDKATIYIINRTNKYPKIKVVYSQNLTANCDLSGESEKDNRHMSDPMQSSIFAETHHDHPHDPNENHLFVGQVGALRYYWEGSPLESEMDKLLDRVVDRVKKRYWQDISMSD
jgi:hypothetical protein